MDAPRLLSIELDASTGVLALAGEFDLGDVDAFRAALDALRAAWPHAITVDLEALTFPRCSDAATPRARWTSESAAVWIEVAESTANASARAASRSLTGA